MLPKPEKIKKTKSPEQLDLVDSLSLEKKIENKRRFVLICLILTTGLSFGFWVYKNFPKIKIDFSLPQIKMSEIQVSSNNFNQSINQILSKDSDNWSIYAKTLPKNIDYSLNAKDLISDSDKIIDSLSKLPDSASSSLVRNSLPQGTKIQQQDTNYLITTPDQKIIMQFKTTDQNSEKSKKIIPLLVEKIYWYLTLK